MHSPDRFIISLYTYSRTSLIDRKFCAFIKCILFDGKGGARIPSDSKIDIDIYTRNFFSPDARKLCREVFILG